MPQEKQCEFFHRTHHAGYAGDCSAFDSLRTERVKPDFLTYERFCECDSEKCGYCVYGKLKSLEKWIKS